MATLTARHHERTSPSLLDRLTDDDPTERRDPEHRRQATVKQLRDSVMRDLGWLLNCVRLSTVQDLAAYPNVRRSVLNFGLPDLAGRTVSSIDTDELERQLRQAIVEFEPRLIERSLEVSVARADGTGDAGRRADGIRAAQDTHPNCLQFTINAELNVQPVPVALRLRTEIDLENGDVSIAEWDRDRATAP